MKILGVKEPEVFKIKLYADESIDMLPFELFEPEAGIKYAMTDSDNPNMVVATIDPNKFDVAVEYIRNKCKALYNVEPIYA